MTLHNPRLREVLNPTVRRLKKNIDEFTTVDLGDRLPDVFRGVEGELANRVNLDLRDEAKMGLVIGGDGFVRTGETHLAHQGEKEKSLSRGLKLFRIRQEVEKLWKNEKEKKWQIWIRYEYGKENKAESGREYGYASGSGISKVMELLRKEIHKNREIPKKVEAYEKQIKKCQVLD